MEELNPILMPLDGHNLIEASAGTGKTYTITALYLRYLLGLHGSTEAPQLPLPVEKILVVTFTDAATSEIKERVRNRLITARDALLGNKCDDEVVNTLISTMAEEQKKQAYLLLDASAKSMDDAAIFTIHGFCQRMLKQHAFESGVAFNLEFILDQTELIYDALKDFWRSFIYPLNEEKTKIVLEIFPAPAALYKKVTHILANHNAQLKPEHNIDYLWQLNDEYLKLLNEFKSNYLCSDFAEKILASGIKKTNIAVKEASLNLLSEFCESEHTSLEIGSKKQGFDIWHSDRLSDLKLYKKGCDIFDHPLVSIMSKLAEYEQSLKEGLPIAIAVTAAKWIQTALITKKQDKGIISPDDLLIYLHQALTADNSQLLARKIAQSYPVAMIDEFQDTDPVQYNIFSSIYNTPDSALTMIGDPKQAIYGFRGADIFTYIEAKHKVDNTKQFTLKKNFRSSSTIVKNVNALFMNQVNSFLYNKDIPFIEVAAKGKTPEKSFNVKMHTQQTSLDFCVYKTDEAVTSKSQGQQVLGKVFASKVANLLRLSSQGKVTIGEAPVIAADICILVRDRQEAHIIKTALLNNQIASVYLSRESIFGSQLAHHLLHFLTALHSGYDEALYRGVLAGPLFGLNYQQIFELSEQENKWQTYLNTFIELLDIWQTKGAMAMLEQLIDTNNLPAVWQALGYPVERWLTDYRHLSEILQQKQLELEGNMRLIRWFGEKISQQAMDNTQLRLESDATLVKIVTMHAAKGLEYPIVFIPFAASYRTATEALYHDNDKLIYDLTAQKHNLIKAEQERLAEDIRLLYVALTRSVHYLCLGLYNLAEGKSRSKPGIEHTALGHLLFAGEDIKSAEDWHKSLISFIDKQQDMAVEFVEDSASESHFDTTTAQKDIQTAVKMFTGVIEKDWRITSFTGLTYNQSYHHNAEPLTPGFEDESHELDWTSNHVDPELSVFSFPKGAKPGSCLHAIFEQINFQTPDCHPENREYDLANVVTEQLDKYDIDEKWHNLTMLWVKQVLLQKLNSQGLSLNLIKREKCLIEMEFFLPLGDLNASQLNKILLSVSGHEYHPISFGQMKGMLTGFIDLIFEYQGQYFILDYKSNYLGENANDYQQNNMSQVMSSHQYHLQYLLYSVALHRLLKQRLIDYDINVHLGGVFYLFLRGVPAGEGIFFKKVATDIILALDAMFDYEADLSKVPPC